MKMLKPKNEEVKSHCNLPLFYDLKINEKYELLSLYILMIKKWESMNKLKNKYEKILMIEEWYSMNKSKYKIC